MELCKDTPHLPRSKNGDEVWVVIKNDSKTTWYMPNWSTDKYTATFIKYNNYMIKYKKRNVYVRHELLKV